MRTEVPKTIIEGERLEWTKSYSDYPATLWTLQYRFRNSTGVGIDILATADGDDFNVVLAKGTSDDFTVMGRHRWQAWIAEIADVNNTFVVGEGTVDVRAGFVSGTLTAVDERSTAKRTLDAIDAAILAFATSDVTEYEISTPAGSRRVKRSDKSELKSMRNYWATLVARENMAERVRNGGAFGTPVLITVRER